MFKNEKYYIFECPNCKMPLQTNILKCEYRCGVHKDTYRHVQVDDNVNEEDIYGCGYVFTVYNQTAQNE